ncbi:hypothetical protein Tco_0552818 [Tanacetum coccineum]
MTMEILPEPTLNKLYGRSDTYAGNSVKEILLNLNLPDHRSVLTEPEMKMEIPRSSKVKFITACSYSIDEYDDTMKARMYVIQDFRYSDTQKVTRSQEGKRLQDNAKRLSLADDLKEAQDHKFIKQVGASLRSCSLHIDKR